MMMFRQYMVTFLRAAISRSFPRCFLLLVLIASGSVVYGQNIVPIRSGVARDTVEVKAPSPAALKVPYLSDLAFASGERLSFSVRYKWGLVNSVVGYADVTLTETSGADGTGLYHCIAKGRTSKFFDRFFKVREHFESWFRKDNLRPVAFVRDTKEGNYIAKNYFLWNRDDESILADVFSSSKGQRHLVLPGRDCTYDLLTLFFFARNIDFDKCRENVRYPISFAIDDDIYDLYFIMLGKEQIKLRDVGTFNTIKFAARLVAGEVFSGEEDMLIWVTDDRNRIPVYFESPILVGEVSGRLESCSGLRYPLDSKTDMKK